MGEILEYLCKGYKIKKRDEPPRTRLFVYTANLLALGLKPRLICDDARTDQRDPATSMLLAQEPQ